MVETYEVNDEKIWVPIGSPERLLPPDVGLKVTLDEMFNLTKDQDLSQHAKMVHERPGRYLGIFDTQEKADQADP